MDVIDDTAQFIQQIGLFDENMRVLISISIAICIVFVVIALLTLKLFNGIFIKVRSTQSTGQDTLNSINNSNQLNTLNHNIEQNPRHCNSDGSVDEVPICQLGARPFNAQNPQNVLTMPNNDCTISAVNSLSERIHLQNYQHFHHHYHHHHHHFHLPPVPNHGNTHNHIVFNSNVFNANTGDSGNTHAAIGLKLTDNGITAATTTTTMSTDGHNLLINLRKGESSNSDNLNRVTTAHGTNESFSMTRLGNANNFISRGHLQGHLHSHHPSHSQQIV